MIANRAEVQPMTVALDNLAGALIAALPTQLIYIIPGRYFMRGLLAGALKG